MGIVISSLLCVLKRSKYDNILEYSKETCILPAKCAGFVETARIHAETTAFAALFPPIFDIILCSRKAWML